MFGIGLNYIKATALSDKDKQEIDALVNDPDMFVRKNIQVENALDGTGPVTVLESQPYQLELTQAEDELRGENPEYQKMDVEGKYMQVPQNLIEARAREIIKRNAIRTRKENKELDFVDAKLDELEDRNVTGLGSILARDLLSTEEKNVVK